MAGSGDAIPEDAYAIQEAKELVYRASPRTDAEWMALHDEVHRIANRAPHPWVVLAHVGEALVDCRPRPRAD
jgi:hypothetical protein